VVNKGGQQHQVTQPVEPADGWAMLEGGGGEMCELLDDLSDEEEASGGYDLGGLRGGLGGGAAFGASEAMADLDLCSGAMPEPAPAMAPPPAPMPASSTPTGAPPAPAKPVADEKARLSRMSGATPGRGGAAKKGGGGGILEDIGNAVSTLAGKLGSRSRSKAKPQRRPASGLRGRCARQVEALSQHALPALREAKDAAAARENLRYLLADLEDLLEQARKHAVSSDPVYTTLSEIVAELRALDEAEVKPGSEPLEALLQRLDDALAGRNGNGNGGGGEEERASFWF